jgi:hypothetical protein
MSVSGYCNHSFNLLKSESTLIQWVCSLAILCHIGISSSASTANLRLADPARTKPRESAILQGTSKYLILMKKLELIASNRLHSIQSSYSRPCVQCTTSSHQSALENDVLHPNLEENTTNVRKQQRPGSLLATMPMTISRKRI